MAEKAKSDGSDEIDVVMKIEDFKNGNYEEVLADFTHIAPDSSDQGDNRIGISDRRGDKESLRTSERIRSYMRKDSHAFRSLG